MVAVEMGPNINQSLIITTIEKVAYFTRATVCKGVRAHVRHFNEWWLYLCGLCFRYGQANFFFSSVVPLGEVEVFLRLWESLFSSSGCWSSSSSRARLFVSSVDLPTEEAEPWPDKDEFAMHSVPVHFRMASDHCWLNIFQKSFMMRSTIALLKGSNIGLIRLSFTLRSFDCRTLEKYSKITGSLGSPGIPSSSQSVSSSDNVESVCISIVESLKTIGDPKGVQISGLVWWGLIEGKFWSCSLSKMLEYYSK